MSFYPRPFRLSRVRDPTLAAFGGATFVAFARLTDGKLIGAFSAMKSGSSKIRQSRAKSRFILSQIELASNWQLKVESVFYTSDYILRIHSNKAQLRGQFAFQI